MRNRVQSIEFCPGRARCEPLNMPGELYRKPVPTIPQVPLRFSIVTLSGEAMFVTNNTSSGTQRFVGHY